MYRSQGLTPEWVIKVGGSLGARPAQLRRLMESLARVARRHWLVVVPGGGRFADEVRDADRRFALGNSAAHWMAILAMDQYGYLLTELAPGVVLVRSRHGLAPGRLNVLAPSAWLLREDPLPHSWDVTSDSIAAWVARALGVRRLMLVKHADAFVGPERGPREMPPHGQRIALDGFSRLVDSHFARVLDPDTGCWFVRGHLPHRIVRLIETGGAKSTGGNSRSAGGAVSGPGARASGSQLP
jgi:aspartokinase-like uncharacterized kinase